MNRVERMPRASIVLGVATGLAVVAAIWLLAIRDDGDGMAFGPELMNAEELRSWAGEQDETVYWAGGRDNETYEVSRTESGNVFVRYLDSRSEASRDEALFLTIGTYPLEDAWGTTTELSRRDEALVGRAPDGALVVSLESRPESVYLAYEDRSSQVEVFDPDGARALRVASSGDVTPIPD